MRRAKLTVAGLMVLGLAACGGVHPDRGTGAASTPAQGGGLAGPQEGTPGNARNLGTDATTQQPK